MSTKLKSRIISRRLTDRLVRLVMRDMPADPNIAEADAMDDFIFNELYFRDYSPAQLAALELIKPKLREITVGLLVSIDDVRNLYHIERRGKFLLERSNHCKSINLDSSDENIIVMINAVNKMRSSIKDAKILKERAIYKVINSVNTTRQLLDIAPEFEGYLREALDEQKVKNHEPVKNEHTEYIENALRGINV